MNRRTFLASAGVAAAVAPWVARSAGTSRGFTEADYNNAIVIDALGGPGKFDPKASDDDDSLSPEALADVKASGITAVNLTIGTVGNSPGIFDQTLARIAGYEGQLQKYSQHLVKVRTAADLRAAKASGRLGIVYGFQDTAMLEGDLSRVGLFRNLGVLIMQPTYNRRNIMGDGCLETANGGLSKLGYELVAEINRLNILLDLSHAGPRTIADGIAASKAPMAISHTGCRDLVDFPRNAYDRELKALADKGGVAGIYFMPFLRASGQPHAEDVIRHLEHAVNVCGEDHVGLGTDGNISATTLDEAYAAFQRRFYEGRAKAGIAAPGEAPDVFNLIPEYNEPRRFLKLAQDLSRRGWATGRIEKILGGNFARLFAEVWKG